MKGDLTSTIQCTSITVRKYAFISKLTQKIVSKACAYIQYYILLVHAKLHSATCTRLLI